jgi:DNA-binding LytR/AlgR family response regulator
MKTRCIIIDDEPLAQEIIQAHLKNHPDVELIGKFNNVLAAYQVILQENIDLLFMDIRMPGIDGMTFYKSLKTPPAVIFTTAFADHAAEGFEVEAIDYLLKPISSDRFDKSISKYLKQYSSEPVQTNNYTYFKVSGQLIKIYHVNLQYAQSVKDYIVINTVKESFIIHMTMKYLNDLLPKHTFQRIHRSYLVNVALIEVIDRSHVKIADAEIPIGNNYRSNISLNELQQQN